MNSHWSSLHSRVISHALRDHSHSFRGVIFEIRRDRLDFRMVFGVVLMSMGLRSRLCSFCHRFLIFYRFLHLFLLSVLCCACFLRAGTRLRNLSILFRIHINTPILFTKDAISCICASGSLYFISFYHHLSGICPSSFVLLIFYKLNL